MYNNGPESKNKKIVRQRADDVMNDTRIYRTSNGVDNSADWYPVATWCGEINVQCGHEDRHTVKANIIIVCFKN